MTLTTIAKENKLQKTPFVEHKSIHCEYFKFPYVYHGITCTSEALQLKKKDDVPISNSYNGCIKILIWLSVVKDILQTF